VPPRTRGDLRPRPRGGKARPPRPTRLSVSQDADRNSAAAARINTPPTYPATSASHPAGTGRAGGTGPASASRTARACAAVSVPLSTNRSSWARCLADSCPTFDTVIAPTSARHQAMPPPVYADTAESHRSRYPTTRRGTFAGRRWGTSGPVLALPWRCSQSGLVAPTDLAGVWYDRARSHRPRPASSNHRPPRPR
jgi:hypothetical protein